MVPFFFSTHFELPPPILAPKTVSLTIVIWKGDKTAIGTYKLQCMNTQVCPTFLENLDERHDLTLLANSSVCYLWQRSLSQPYLPVAYKS